MYTSSKYWQEINFEKSQRQFWANNPSGRSENEFSKTTTVTCVPKTFTMKATKANNAVASSTVSDQTNSRAVSPKPKTNLGNNAPLEDKAVIPDDKNAQTMPKMAHES